MDMTEMIKAQPPPEEKTPRTPCQACEEVKANKALDSKQRQYPDKQDWATRILAWIDARPLWSIAVAVGLCVGIVLLLGSVGLCVGVALLLRIIGAG